MPSRLLHRHVSHPISPIPTPSLTPISPIPASTPPPPQMRLSRSTAVWLVEHRALAPRVLTATTHGQEADTETVALNLLDSDLLGDGHAVRRLLLAVGSNATTTTTTSIPELLCTPDEYCSPDARHANWRILKDSTTTLLRFPITDARIADIANGDTEALSSLLDAFHQHVVQPKENNPGNSPLKAKTSTTKARRRREAYTHEGSPAAGVPDNRHEKRGSKGTATTPDNLEPGAATSPPRRVCTVPSAERPSWEAGEEEGTTTTTPVTPTGEVSFDHRNRAALLDLQKKREAKAAHELERKQGDDLRLARQRHALKLKMEKDFCARKREREEQAAKAKAAPQEPTPAAHHETPESPPRRARLVQDPPKPAAVHKPLKKPSNHTNYLLCRDVLEELLVSVVSGEARQRLDEKERVREETRQLIRERRKGNKDLTSQSAQAPLTHETLEELKKTPKPTILMALSIVQEIVHEAINTAHQPPPALTRHDRPVIVKKRNAYTENKKGFEAREKLDEIKRQKRNKEVEEAMEKDRRREKRQKQLKIRLEEERGKQKEKEEAEANALKERQAQEERRIKVENEKKSQIAAAHKKEVEEYKKRREEEIKAKEAEGKSEKEKDALKDKLRVREWQQRTQQPEQSATQQLTEEYSFSTFPTASIVARNEPTQHTLEDTTDGDRFLTATENSVASVLRDLRSDPLSLLPSVQHRVNSHKSHNSVRVKSGVGSGVLHTTEGVSVCHELTEFLKSQKQKQVQMDASRRNPNNGGLFAASEASSRSNTEMGRRERLPHAPNIGLTLAARGHAFDICNREAARCLASHHQYPSPQDARPDFLDPALGVHDSSSGPHLALPDRLRSYGRVKQRSFEAVFTLTSTLPSTEGTLDIPDGYQRIDPYTVVVDVMCCDGSPRLTREVVCAKDICAVGIGYASKVFVRKELAGGTSATPSKVHKAKEKEKEKMVEVVQMVETVVLLFCSDFAAKPATQLLTKFYNLLSQVAPSEYPADSLPHIPSPTMRPKRQSLKASKSSYHPEKGDEEREDRQNHSPGYSGDTPEKRQTQEETKQDPPHTNIQIESNEGAEHKDEDAKRAEEDQEEKNENKGEKQEKEETPLVVEVEQPTPIEAAIQPPLSPASPEEVQQNADSDVPEGSEPPAAPGPDAQSEPEEGAEPNAADTEEIDEPSPSPAEAENKEVQQNAQSEPEESFELDDAEAAPEGVEGVPVEGEPPAVVKEAEEEEVPVDIPNDDSNEAVEVQEEGGEAEAEAEEDTAVHGVEQSPEVGAAVSPPAEEEEKDDKSETHIGAVEAPPSAEGEELTEATPQSVVTPSPEGDHGPDGAKEGGEEEEADPEAEEELEVPEEEPNAADTEQDDPSLSPAPEAEGEEVQQNAQGEPEGSFELDDAEAAPEVEEPIGEMPAVVKEAEAEEEEDEVPVDIPNDDSNETDDVPETEVPGVEVPEAEGITA